MLLDCLGIPGADCRYCDARYGAAEGRFRCYAFSGCCGRHGGLRAALRSFRRYACPDGCYVNSCLCSVGDMLSSSTRSGSGSSDRSQ
jgi:hypothetical protein